MGTPFSNSEINLPKRLANNPYTVQPEFRLLHIGRRQRLYHTRAIHKSRAEDPIRIRKHSIL